VIGGESSGRRAARQGVTIHECREVTEIMAENGKVTGVSTSKGPISAGVVINAANAWAALINSPAKLDVAMRVCRSRIIITEQLPRFMRPFASCNRFGCYRHAL
jgi:glycine/D-amino acid oxidase-like deaminating enzyme